MPRVIQEAVSKPSEPVGREKGRIPSPNALEPPKRTPGKGSSPPSEPETEPLEPFWTTTDRETVRLYHGNVIDVLKKLPSKSVQCCITSPPYWALRDYGVDHQLGSEAVPDCKQLIEVSPETFRKGNCAELDWANGCHVCRMVLVFREVRRVLRDDATLWLNYGDSYSNAGTRQGDRDGGVSDGVNEHQKVKGGYRPTAKGIPNGNLCGIPWRVALALQADGWVLRQDIIWHKPSPMPESVTNRCTKAHEYVFLMTKRGSGYFCDMEAIKETSKEESRARETRGVSSEHKNVNGQPGQPPHSGSVAAPRERDLDRPTTALSNKRSVWTIAASGYAGAHFACFPPKLIEPMILAGTSEHGCCANCESPWRRVTEAKKLTRERPNDYVKRTGEEGTGNSCSNSVAGVETKTVGWEQTCECKTNEVKPCTVLDCFIGSGTSCQVSFENGRNSIGIDLSEKYLKENAVPRIEGAILAISAKRHLVRRETKTVKLTGKAFK